MFRGRQTITRLRGSEKVIVSLLRSFTGCVTGSRNAARMFVVSYQVAFLPHIIIITDAFGRAASAVTMSWLRAIFNNR